MKRCSWPGDDPLYLAYHDEEWGVPVHDDIRLFEKLTLEGAQAGLSWITILRKRAHYRKVFDGFQPERIARYTPARVEQLLQDPGIVRNRLKVESTVQNARAYLELVEQVGSLDDFLWQFVDGRPVQHAFHSLSELPAHTPESKAMSVALKQRGFRFVGPTTCYALMQATGMVNDHVVSCFRHREVARLASPSAA